MREIITDTIKLLGYRIHVIFNYRDYPVLFKDADVSPILGYKAPDGVATYCYRHDNDLVLFLNNSKHNYTTPKVIYHLANHATSGRKPLLNADKFWDWYTHDLAFIYYKDTNGNLINHVKNVHTNRMWNKPKSKNKKNNNSHKAKQNNNTISKQRHTIYKLRQSIKTYHNQINNIVINSYADKLLNLIKNNSNSSFHYSLFRFTELMRNLGLVDYSVHTAKRLLIDNAYLVKVGWHDYIPARRYRNLFHVTNSVLGHHKIELSQLGFVYFTNTIYSTSK